MNDIDHTKQEDKAKNYRILDEMLMRLINIYMTSTQHGINTMFLINGGGIVTLLAYLSSPNIKINFYLIISLCFFILGLCISVVVVMADYFLCRQSVINFNKNLEYYSEGYIDIRAALKYSNDFMKRIGQILPWCALASISVFFIGTGVGMYGYFKNLM